MNTQEQYSFKAQSNLLFDSNELAVNNPQDDEEMRHMQKIIKALRFYRKYAHARVDKSETYLLSLPTRHQHMLTLYRKHLSDIRDCIDKNQEVIRKMINENALLSNYDEFPNTLENHDEKMLENVNIPMGDVENEELVDEHFKILKAQSTLKLIARDWSVEGLEERDQSYKPIIEAIKEFYPPTQFKLNEIKVLVPGAGLGRLTYELACLGYECEGNEYSYFMLIASHFVLNRCTDKNKYTLYPWIHQYVNNLQMADQVAPISFPDVCPAKNPPKGNIMMAAGDFLEVYKTPGSFDCVATCFFIDCANNVVAFIETIFKILVPGGLWVNLGPLLYHFSDIQNENSIEPTFENLILIIETIGFEILRYKTAICTKYAQNPKSMLKSSYESLFWICRKPNDSVSFD